MLDPPTEPQLRYLRSLGYKGIPPETKAEASWLIDACKSQEPGPAMEKEFAVWRENERKIEAKEWTKQVKGWIKEQRALRKEEYREVRQDSAGVIAGFMFSEEITCDVAKAYAGAFLPVQVVRKQMDILPGGKQCLPEICDCSCDYEEILAHTKMPKDMRTIVGPGRIETIAKYKQKKSLRCCGGCLVIIILLILLTVLVTFLA